MSWMDERLAKWRQYKTFGEFLDKQEMDGVIEFNIIADDQEIECTVSWDGDWAVLTDEGRAFYAPLLAAEIEIVNEGWLELKVNGEKMYELARDFCESHSGYCSDARWNKLFREVSHE